MTIYIVPTTNSYAVPKIQSLITEMIEEPDRQIRGDIDLNMKMIEGGKELQLENVLLTDIIQYSATRQDREL